MTRQRSQLINFVSKFLGTIRFGNDHVAVIRGYGDYQIGNVMISQVYYVEGLGHNLFSVGALCYPTNDGEDLGKLKPKADIGIFIGYAPAKKAYQIYNRRTRLIMETIHVKFEELTTMAFEQFGLGLELQLMTYGTISSGLYFNPPLSVVSPVPAAAALRPVDPTGSPSSTSIDQVAPFASTSSIIQETQSPIISEGVEEQFQPA
ncbi:hypothetical protein Tco_0987411 [Tanacetum coccineum]